MTNRCELRRSFEENGMTSEARARLLRSHLRRQKILEEMKTHRSKTEEKTDPDPLPADTNPPNLYLPPLYSNVAFTQNLTRNVKSDLVEMMIIQNAQVHQMMSQQMAMSLMIPPPQQPTVSSHSSSSSRAIDRQRDKLLLSLVVDLHRMKSNRIYDQSSAPPVLQPVYLPVLPQISEDKSHQSKAAEKSPDSYRHPMTSRWKPRVSVKTEQAPSIDTTRTVNPQHRRRALRRFRAAAYAAVFTMIMRNKQAKRLMYVLRNPPIDDRLLTGIRIKECVLALHKVYLDPEKKMFKILSQIFDESVDLSAVLTDQSTKIQRQRVRETLASFIENIAHEMAYTPPKIGSLGTDKHTNLSNLLQPQQRFPSNYFWNVEKDLLNIDSYSRTPENMGSNEEFIVLIGLCLGRGLICTILRYPYQFGLTQSGKTEVLSTKIRLIVTLFIYLIRKLYAPRNASPVPAALSDDLNRKLLGDEIMAKLFEKLKTSFDFSEKLLRDWGQKYLKKLHRS